MRAADSQGASWDGVNPVSCDLCPRACGANRAAGQRGVCGADDEVLVARTALHFWEEPPVSGEDGSGTIFFSHCSLRCAYCQNAVISHGDMGHAVTCDGLARACLDLQEEGALNVNFVTPTHYAPHARAAVRRAREEGLGLPVIWNTSGYETVRSIRENAGTVDVYLTDFKYADAASGQRYSRVDDYPDRAIRALDAMVECAGEPVFDMFRGQERIIRGVIVRHLLLPGQLADAERAVRLLHERYGSAVRLSLMNQYTPVVAHAAQADDARARTALERCPELAETVPPEEYEELLSFADDIGVEDYFWQEGETCSESFIPPFAEDSEELRGRAQPSGTACARS